MNHNDTEIVSALQARLAGQVGRERFDLWFGAGTRFAFTEDRLVILAASELLQGCLRANFLRDIQACCLSVLGRNVAVEFTVDAALTPAAEPIPLVAVPALRVAEPEADSANAVQSRTGRRPFKRLETFIVGESNRLAMTSVRMALDRLGSVSPLFLHGSTGVGKTHLLEGVWSAVKMQDRNRHVIYLSAEQFTTLFVDAVRGSGMANFRNKYRGVDLLIVDDVQFLCGKSKTVDELLHTVDTLQREGRQIVLAADRAPGELTGLGPELLTRLQGGMICRIDPPDYETRLGILRQLADGMSLCLPPTVAQFVATHLTAHARELAGGLNRLLATSLATGQPLSLSLAEQALGDLIQQSQRAVRLRDIERVVCEAFGLEDDSLRAGSKAKGVNHPRMFAMWLARKHTRAAMGEISRYFGRRSHSSVVSAQKKIGVWISHGDRIDLAGRSCSAEEALRRIEERLRAS